MVGAGGTAAGGSGRLLAVLWVRSGPVASPRHAVRTTRAVLGRDAGCDVVLESPAVSARHAELRLHDGIWSVTDFESINGTWVDGHRISSVTPLAPGAEVRLGDVTLAFAPCDEWDDSVAIRLNGPVGMRPFQVTTTAPSAAQRLLVVGAVLLLLAVVAYFILAAG